MPKKYKNYLRNRKLRRGNLLIRSICDGEPVKFWEKHHKIPKKEAGIFLDVLLRARDKELNLKKQAKNNKQGE